MKTRYLCLLLMSGFTVGAQSEAPMQRSWGGWISLESQLLGIGAAGNQPWDQPEVYAQSPGAGWGVGVYRRLPLGRHLGLQPALSLASNRQAVYFPGDDGTAIRQQFGFADLELAMHLVWIDKAGNMPMQGHVILGPRIAWNVAGLPANPGIGMLRERLALDAGLGLGFRLGSGWVLEPGIVYSQSLFSVHDHVNRPYDDRVGRVLRDRISIRLAISRRAVTVSTPP